MAEGLLNVLYRDRYEAYSAGTQPAEVNPYAIRVMAEIGVDISTNRSKSIEEFRGRAFDYVVTVCDHAKEVCPFFPGEKVLHHSFTDPSTFKGSEDKILEEVRQVRDEIKNWIERTFERCMHARDSPLPHNSFSRSCFSNIGQHKHNARKQEHGS